MSAEYIEQLKSQIEQAKDLEKTTRKLPQDKRSAMTTRIRLAEKFVAEVEARTASEDDEEWSEHHYGRLQSSIDSCYHYSSYVGD